MFSTLGSFGFPNKCNLELLSQHAVETILFIPPVSGGIFAAKFSGDALKRTVIKEASKAAWSKVCGVLPYVAGAVLVICLAAGVGYYIYSKTRKNEVTAIPITMDNLMEENAKLKEALDQIMKENAALKKENAEIKEELTAVRKENAEMKDELTAVRKDNAEMKEELTAVRKENAEMKTKMDKMQTTMDKVQEQNADLMTKMDDMKTTHDNDMAELKRMIASLAAQNQKNGGN